MKLHYFEQEKADADDVQLGMAKTQGYVPRGCLLGGATVFSEITKNNSPCWGCNGPRDKCGGKPKRDMPPNDEFTERRQASAPNPPPI